MAKKKSRTAGPVLGKRFELRMSPKEKRAFQAAARAQGIPLALWLRLAAWKVVNDHDGRVELLELD